VVTRGLTELLEEAYRFEQLHALGPTLVVDQSEDKPRFTRAMVIDLAEKAGFVLTRDKRGRVVGVEGRRPTTLNLLEELDAQKPWSPVAESVPRIYRRGSGSVHGTFMAWVEMIGSRDGQDLDIRFLPVLAMDLTYALQMHIRAIDAWNAGWEWSPEDLFTSARQSALAPFWFVYFDLIDAIGLREESRARLSSEM
jgi:hypothetical protein